MGGGEPCSPSSAPPVFLGLDNDGARTALQVFFFASRGRKPLVSPGPLLQTPPGNAVSRGKPAVGRRILCCSPSAGAKVNNSGPVFFFWQSPATPRFQGAGTGIRGAARAGEALGRGAPYRRVLGERSSMGAPYEGERSPMGTLPLHPAQGGTYEQHISTLHRGAHIGGCWGSA